MCELFAGQDPANYEKITRSVRIDGQSTSICLEAIFWQRLDELAKVQGLTTPRLITLLYDEVMARYGEISNFTSMLRSSGLIFAQNEKMVREQGKFADVA